jgi:hypothetical protein
VALLPLDGAAEPLRKALPPVREPGLPLPVLVLSQQAYRLERHQRLPGTLHHTWH